MIAPILIIPAKPIIAGALLPDNLCEELEQDIADAVAVIVAFRGTYPDLQAAQ